MNVVCMIRDHPALRYFVNRIHQDFPVQRVFVEQPRAKLRLEQKLKESGWRGFLSDAQNAIARKLNHAHNSAVLRGLFGDLWQELNPDIPVSTVPSINGNDVMEDLERLQVDVLAVEGTGIIKNKVLNLVPVTLNLHWGLSPYYRGTHCTDWALVNWDPHNIGVTIHKLTKNIDGGSIVAQARPTIEPGDLTNDINMRLTHLGTELMVEALRRHASGEELVYHTQDLSRGYLTLNRQYTWRVRGVVRAIERDGRLAVMLERPSRSQRLPIITFDGIQHYYDSPDSETPR